VAPGSGMEVGVRSETVRYPLAFSSFLIIWALISQLRVTGDVIREDPDAIRALRSSSIIISIIIFIILIFIIFIISGTEPEIN